MRISNISIKRKLLLFYILVGIIPLVLVGFLASHFATQALMQKSFDQLMTVQSLRKNRIENDFGMRLESIQRLNQRNDVIQLFTKLKKFTNGPKLTTLGYKTTREYQAILNAHANSLKQYIAIYGYQDLLLIEPQKGEIMFAISNLDRIGTDLDTGNEHGSTLDKLTHRVIRDKSLHISDFTPYKDSTGLTHYAAYVGQPYYDHNGELTGVIVAQLGPELIDAIVESREGMGKSGETYIVSYLEALNKYEFRTTVHTTGGGRWVMGKTMPALPYWEDTRAARGQGNTGEYVDSVGASVLVAANMLEIGNLRWLLVSKIDTAEVMEPVETLLLNIALIGTILLLIVSIASVMFARNFTNPIFKATNFAQSIADGKLDIDFKIQRQDELGVLGRALDTMAKRLREMDWISSGTEHLDNSLRGEHNPEKLTRLALDVITGHFDAPLAGIYLFNQDGTELHLSARHGWSHKDESSTTRIKAGEGLIGDAALSTKPIYFSYPETVLPVVNYGAGEVQPTHYMAAPLSFERKTLGVLLIGSFKEFETHEQTFIDENSHNLGTLLAAAQSHVTIQKLLERAQEQENELRENNEELTRQAQALIESERELQTQQEELRVTNEELEEQTRALRDSENELQSQQEELRVTNEELEERSHELERHNQDIELKNRELLEARDEIRAKIDEVEQANKYKSEFLANMSHELRTPLNSILILSQLMAENKDNNLSSRQVESAQTINSSGSDLLKLINDILDLSKVEAGKIDLKFEQTKLAAFVTDLRRVFDDQANDRNIPFAIDIKEDVPESITTDAHRLQQVIRNLLSNAFKFTDPGKQVTLRISRAAAASLPMAWSHPVEQTLVFEVEDQGIGIAADRQAEIFEAFRQADGGTSRKYGGTGLGLSISRSLTQALGGEINLTSTEGVGSTFRIFLPTTPDASTLDSSGDGSEVVRIHRPYPNAPQKRNMARPANVQVARDATQDIIATAKTEPAPTQEKPAPAKSEPRRSEISDDRKILVPEEKSILIIEDDPSSAEILRNLAHDRGFKCLVAEDGKTGLHFADFFKPHAILLDIGLPDIDGWEVMERLKADPDTRHIPVHFISGHDKQMEAMRMGAVGFLTKPITLEAMDEAFAKIETVLDKPVRSLLIVEDDLAQSQAIKQLIGNGDVICSIAQSGAEALEHLNAKRFDCMILDLGLQDISGFELLEKIQDIPEYDRLPVIIYTGRDLTKGEENKLRKYADSIIIKGVRSPERLVDESALFLHRLETSLPERHRVVMRTLHDRDASLKDKTILLVDDDMRNVFALSSVLESKSVNVIIAGNGRESLDRLEENPEIDLVLMDIMMPEMDGYEAMREIRKNSSHAKLPIIALTAKAMKGDRSVCIEAGANDYLAKPVDTDKLLSLLRVWLYT